MHNFFEHCLNCYSRTPVGLLDFNKNSRALQFAPIRPPNGPPSTAAATVCFFFWTSGLPNPQSFCTTAMLSRGLVVDDKG